MQSHMVVRGWLGAGFIVLAFVLLAVAINPVREFPVEDDWDYSKTVLNVLQTGTFHRLQVTQATVLFPAMWGTLFSKILGYSFATLRLSTLVLAIGSLLFFYASLGELGFDSPRQVSGTLALMVAPAFVYLAFSFMTDIFLLFGILGALYFYVRAWRAHSWQLAFMASLFAGLGFLARQVGAFVPVGFALYILIQCRAELRADLRSGACASLSWLRLIVAGTAVPMLVIGLYLAWSRFGGGANWADGARTLTGTVGFWLQIDTPGVFVRRFAIAASTIALYTLPLWAGLMGGVPSLRRGWSLSTRWQQALIAVTALLSVIALVRAAARGEWFPYLTDILTRAGFRPYLAFFAESWGVHRPLILSDAGSALLTVAAGGLGVLLTALVIGRLRARFSPELGLVYLTTLVLALASLTFFTYFERYLLPLIPGVIVLLLDATRGVRFSLPAAVVGVIAVALISVALMTDYFGWNEARWNAGRALLVAGVPVEKIDGGYEWNGWQLYDASIKYIQTHQVEMTIDPWKYILDPDYMIAFLPPPGYRIVQDYSFATPLRPGGVDHVYLLRREAR